MSVKLSIIIYILHELLLFDVLSGLVVVAVKHIVLEDENDVEKDGHDTEHPLDDVETSTGEGRFVMSHCLNHILQDRESAACQIEHDVCYRPAHGALSLVVEVHLCMSHESCESYLRHVLDEGDQGLAIAGNSEEFYVLIDFDSRKLDDEHGQHKDPLACNQNHWPQNYSALAALTIIDPLKVIFSSILHSHKQKFGSVARKRS